MTAKQAPRRKVTSSLLSAAIVLVAVASAHPSIAATGSDARCDQSMDTPPMSPANDGNLAIQVIDHGTASASAIDTAPGDELAADGPMEPRAEILLRRIFDGARVRQPSLPEPEVTENRRVPLALDKTDGVEDPTAVPEAEPADSVAELPGLSADEFLRYRRQMYRTDI